jgi:hypothetical protein
MSRLIARIPTVERPPPHWLAISDAARRFGVSQWVIRGMCHAHQGLAVRWMTPHGPGLVVDPAMLGLLLADRVDLAAAAAQCGVSVDGLDAGKIGVLLALNRRKRPPPRHASVTEVDHAD